MRNNRWRVNGIPRGDVARQVTEGAMAVKEFLCRAHPELGRSLLRWVDGVVVLTHPLCRVKVDRSWAPVARFSELLPLIECKPARPRYTPEVGQMLAGALSRGARESFAPRLGSLAGATPAATRFPAWRPRCAAPPSGSRWAFSFSGQ